MKTCFAVVPTLLATAVGLGIAIPPAHGQVPNLLNYQGRIVSNGTNFHGTGLFRFALVNPTGTQTYWANSPGNPPTSSVSLGVSNGLYSVLLGDTSVANMASLPAAVFSNPDVRLRVWFNNGANGFQLLAPDQRVGAVGYALMAGNVPFGSITASHLAPASITATHLASSALNVTNMTPHLEDYFKFSPRFRFGDCTNCSHLDIQGTDICTPAITLDGCESEISIHSQTNGVKTVLLSGEPYGGRFYTRDEHSRPTTMVGSSGSEGGLLHIYNGTGAISIVADGDQNGSAYLELRRANGTPGILLDADSSLGGSLVSAQIMRITGGSDLSENFDIQPGDGTDDPQPGHIVSIDPANPGKLVVSSRAYDRTVAGIVSGANGIRTGMMMGQHGSVADGKHPVALTGRVYCWVDADAGGAIEPGDLLTTAITPGHGMKAADPARSHGAIIGKAMTPLSAGRGLVLVLVSLQ